MSESIKSLQESLYRFSSVSNNLYSIRRRGYHLTEILGRIEGREKVYYNSVFVTEKQTWAIDADFKTISSLI